ncbi:reverse transcriptase domain-containing protein [Trichonephila clavipes]|nr:reverse transcriptase domain-containing protein [Trichonephila clavipes]
MAPFSMNSAILSDSDNVTAFGVADAPRVEVRAHGEKYATRTLNILQLNINGTQRKIEELTEILNVNKTEKDRAGGGLAFLVKLADIKLREIIMPPTTDYDENSTEVQAITVLLPQQEVTIINTYHPDNSDINLDLLNTLLDIKSDTKILLGDLNAKSPSWGSRTLDLKGSQIEDLLCDNDLSILNDKRSTYLSKTNDTTSALDITAINHQTASQATWKILKSAISDHFPIITSINQRVDGTIQSKRSWNFRKANWRKFTSELEMLCSLLRHTPSTRDYGPLLRILMLLQNVLSLGSPKISQHSKVIKTLNNQSTHQKADIPTNIISSSGRDAATNKETASLLAKHYENKRKLTFNANDRKLLRTYRKTIQDSKRYNHKNIFTIPFLMEELEAAIAKMNPGKAPGPDDPELRFSSTSEQTTNKALGKLNILRKLCELLGAQDLQTLKSTFCIVIKTGFRICDPNLDSASISVKRKLDSVQHRAAKIIIGAVSSTNNEKAEQECGLPPLKQAQTCHYQVH